MDSQLSTLKEKYPKTYMHRKLPMIIKEQQGYSDFEIYSGVSQCFTSVTPKVQPDPIEFKMGNIDQY